MTRSGACAWLRSDSYDEPHDATDPSYRHLPGRPRPAAPPPRRLRRGDARVLLARTDGVQLGAGLVRRGRGGASRPGGAASGRRRRRHHADLRRYGGQVQPGGQLAARARRTAWRPAVAHARQHPPAVGGHPRRDQARRGDHPGQHPAQPGRSRRPHRPRQRAVRGDRDRAAGEVPAPAGLRRGRLGAGPGGARRRRGGRTVASLRRGVRRTGAVRPGRPDGRQRPGDVHLNISSPGWAKHAWSNVFAPWNAEATALILGYERFNAELLLRAIGEQEVSTFCAPPTVWRMLIQADLGAADVSALRECVAAGEPLNPEVIERVRQAWRITVRDGYGQTETTAQVGNCPGQPLKLGSMGRPLPGYTVALLDPITGERAEEGELCLDLSRRPLGLMTGYRGDPERDAAAMRGGFYHTGDVASRDSDGYLTYVGRTDDVFKASDYRISPFELESVLIEHEAVAEAAVVPSPDPLRLAVPKAYVTLVAGAEPSSETALAILAYTRERLAPYKRVRRLEFSDLPKTISGKIR